MSIVSPSDAGKRSGLTRAKIQENRRRVVIPLAARGMTAVEIAKQLGLPVRTIWRDIRECREEISTVSEAVDNSMIDAEDILERLTDMFDADIADIIDPETKAWKPISEWPRVWRHMLSGVDVKELFERSQDGGEASWDKIGEIIKLKFVDPLEVIKIAAALKSVDALTKPSAAVEINDNRSIVFQWQSDERPGAIEAEAKEVPENG